MAKKVIIWLGNDFTHYCLAYALEKKHDFELYGISEVPNKPKQFFEKQKLVSFKKIWYFHDHIQKNTKKANMEYLKEFEKKYQIDLWKLIQNERIFIYNDYYKFSSNEILNLIEQECRLFEKILEDIKPDYLFTKISSLQHQEIFYQMCKKIGIKTIVLNYSMLGGTSILSEDPTKLDYTENNTLNQKKRNFNELEEYVKQFDLSKQLKDKILPQGTKKIDLLKASKKFFLQSDSHNSNTHYTYYGRTKVKVFWYTLKDILRTKIRKKFIDNNLIKEINFKGSFVYFPLQMEMERSLLLGAPYYINQIEIIKWAAKSLPINFKLVVKEHPIQVARGWRKSDDYNEIIKIPNIVFLHPDVITKEIFKKCSLVITIAGNPGFEALFYGKPVITFEDMRYSHLPSVKTLKNIDKFPNLIRELLNLKIESESLDEYIRILEKNVSKFNYADFIGNLGKEFFYNHNLIDVEIPEEKMKQFLEKNLDMLNILADDHIKKINF